MCRLDIVEWGQAARVRERLCKGKSVRKLSVCVIIIIILIIIIKFLSLYQNF